MNYSTGFPFDAAHFAYFALLIGSIYAMRVGCGVNVSTFRDQPRLIVGMNFGSLSTDFLDALSQTFAET